MWLNVDIYFFLFIGLEVNDKWWLCLLMLFFGKCLVKGIILYCMIFFIYFFESEIIWLMLVF